MWNIAHRYSELVRKDYSLDEAQRLSVPSADEALRERENFDYSYDEMLSKSLCAYCTVTVPLLYCNSSCGYWCTEHEKYYQRYTPFSHTTVFLELMVNLYR